MIVKKWIRRLHALVLAAALLFVGYFLFHEPLSWNKFVGIGICLLGLAVIKIK